MQVHDIIVSFCAEIKPQSSHAAKQAAVKPSRTSKSNLQKLARYKANSSSTVHGIKTDIIVHVRR